jgi:hypothetical protein
MADDPKPPDSFKIQFHYLKSSDYREVACHGAIGNITPQGKIWMALYAERQPLPRTVAYPFPRPAEGQKTISFDEATAGPPILDSREGIIRHVELSAYLDVDTAERLQKWLGDRVAEVRALGAPR